MTSEKPANVGRRQESDVAVGVVPSSYGTPASALWPDIPDDASPTCLPATSDSARPEHALARVTLIAVWALLGGNLVLCNKYIYASMGFPYPLFLTSYHMLLAAAARWVMHLHGFRQERSSGCSLPQTTSLSVQQNVLLPWNCCPTWQANFASLSTLIPPLLLATSLSFSNLALVRLNLGTAQMLKILAPIFTLFVEAMRKTPHDRQFTFAFAAIAACGGSLVALGDISVSGPGLLFQLGSVVLTTYLAVFPNLLRRPSDGGSPGLSASVYLLASGVLALGSLCTEGIDPVNNIWRPRVLLMVWNGAVAVAFNLISPFIAPRVSRSQSLIANVGKDAVLIRLSFLVFETPATVLQIFGYAIACGTLLLLKRMRSAASQPEPLLEPGRSFQGSFHSASAVLTSATRPPRWLLIATGSVVACVAFLFLHVGGSPHRLSCIGSFDSIGKYHHSTTALVQRSVTYPLNSTIARNGQDKFSLFTQSGPGSLVIPEFDPTVDVNRLPRLAWVVVATPDAIWKFGHLLNHLSCYCLRVGIPFYIDHHVMADDRHFFTARQRSVAKYLRYHQWVMVTDADTVVVDSSRDPREWLDDTVDAIFGDRRNFEICACAFFLRNSPGGWSFLRRWYSWADRHSNINWDNGDLNEMVVAGLNPGAPNDAKGLSRMEGHVDSGPNTNCINDHQDWGPYNGDFLSCVRRSLEGHRTADDSKAYWDAALWDWMDGVPSPKFRSYKVLAGFNRWGWDPAHRVMPWDEVVLPSDFLITGKALEQHLNEDNVLCTGKEWISQPRWDLSEARQRLVEEGITWWPGCWDDGVNVCSQYSPGTFSGE